MSYKHEHLAMENADLKQEIEGLTELTTLMNQRLTNVEQMTSYLLRGVGNDGIADYFQESVLSLGSLGFNEFDNVLFNDKATWPLWMEGVPPDTSYQCPKCRTDVKAFTVAYLKNKPCPCCGKAELGSFTQQERDGD